MAHRCDYCLTMVGEINKPILLRDGKGYSDKKYYTCNRCLRYLKGVFKWAHNSKE